MNDDMEGMWQEMLMTRYKAQVQHVWWEWEKVQKLPSGRQVLGWYRADAHLEHSAVVLLPTGLQQSECC